MDPQLKMQRRLAFMGKRRMRWGRDDCVLWAATVSREITGHDLLRLDRWRNKRQGLARIALDGTLGRALLKKFKARGLERVDAAEARPGAFALTLLDGELFLAVSFAPGWYACRQSIGVKIINASDLKKAFQWAM